MESSVTITKKINGYMDQLSISQKKAVLSVAKALAESKSDEERWDDKEFVAEMERRVLELENKESNGYSWEQVKQMANISAISKNA